jgi:thiamine biosynthesis lipoprotein
MRRALDWHQAPARPSVRRWRVWGTSVVVAVTDAGALDAACAAVRAELAAFDLACSRFRPDSELSALNRRAGEKVAVGPVLFDTIRCSLRAATLTGGAVVPTIGGQLTALGYDRDFDAVCADGDVGPLPAPPTRPAPWSCLEIDPVAQTVRVPADVSLDFGALAKARCVDRSAARAARANGSGVLVDIGGDLAAAGPPPPGGWAVAVVTDARHETDSDTVVAITAGGLASSGTAVRTWTRGDRVLHHIVDPSTGWPAPPVWSVVTVAAASCVDANTAATAAVVWGGDAPFRLAQLGLPARLVGRDGSIEHVGGWPDELPVRERHAAVGGARS